MGKNLAKDYSKYLNSENTEKFKKKKSNQTKSSPKKNKK
jgi:hypothetical protein